MSTTQSDDTSRTGRAETAEEAVERHGDILEEWAEEDTRRGRLARTIIRIGGDDAE